jgi:hypothetical protein
MNASDDYLESNCPVGQIEVQTTTGTMVCIDQPHSGAASGGSALGPIIMVVVLVLAGIAALSSRQAVSA